MRALDQEPALEGLEDDEVLRLAATEQRILVTYNVADFPRILRDWPAAQRAHAGVTLVDGIDHSKFALIARGVERRLELRPAEAGWSDFPAILDRRFARRSPTPRRRGDSDHRPTVQPRLTDVIVGAATRHAVPRASGMRRPSHRGNAVPAPGFALRLEG